MCGILGLISPVGASPGLAPGVVQKLRDRMAHRGPDDAGYLDRGNVVLAHRRLAVIDLSEAAHQPMSSEDGRFAIVYNGELYNDAELRDELARAGWRFRSSSDTETILAALARWGPAGILRLRGMYAFGFHDAHEGRFLLARDPLGIKPLYHWRGTHAGVPTVVFASEIRPILDHPAVSPQPDTAAISAYLTTIRTTVGERTLFEGVRTLLPGQIVEIDLRSDALPTRRTSCAIGRAEVSGASIVEGVRSAVEDSVRAHLRSDVPTCCLLSGGLDSTIITKLARRESTDLWTYCAGGPGGASGESGAGLDDLSAARLVAGEIGTLHAEALVSRELFGQRWLEMVESTGVPLSTPNEVAIHEVARRLRDDGKVVALSGEGADELFGGYDILLDHAAAFEAAPRSAAGADLASRRARFQADDAAWIPIAAKPAVMSEAMARRSEGDAVLLDAYTREFADLDDGSQDGLQVHLKFQRRVNLAGLLLRLDSASMLAGVEGRTPFADVRIAEIAESLPMPEKFAARSGADIKPGPARTKLILRRAFADEVPPRVLERAKASFPLPFQAWCGDGIGSLADSGIAREFFSEAAIATVRARPAELWPVAWPMLNIAIWARRWWG